MSTDVNWQFWHDNVADMPTFNESDRSWFDLETGIPYDKNINYIPVVVRQKFTPGIATIEQRNTAKFFGGKALLGSAKQKKWAEEIRAAKIMDMPERQATLACDPNGLLKHSKFWIENREKSAHEIGTFAEKYKSLIVEWNEAKAGRGDRSAESIVSEYNALTKKWGFKE